MPKARQPKQRPAPSQAEVEAKRQEKLEYDRQRSKTPERREYRRIHVQEKRRKDKELGLCVDCPNPAQLNQTRCSTCAEKHRVGCRRSEERAAQQRDQASGQGRTL